MWYGDVIITKAKIILHGPKPNHTESPQTKSLGQNHNFLNLSYKDKIQKAVRCHKMKISMCIINPA